MSFARAEKRRMARDPLAILKMTVANTANPERVRLIAHGQIVIYEMNQVQMRMNGLAWTPKKLRESRAERLTEEWNQNAEKLMAIQEQINNIDNPKPKKKNAKPRKSPVAKSKKGSTKRTGKRKGND